MDLSERKMPEEHDQMTKKHGNTIVGTAPCGVHPLHIVKIRVNGTRSGCSMCEMQIDDICRSLARVERR